MDLNIAKPGDTAQLMEQILYEVKRVVVGQDRFLERVMVAMLAQGHLLVEGVPGLAKTMTIKTLASTRNGCSSGHVVSPMVTWCSCIASSSALCTLAGARLISSARIRLAKSGPRCTVKEAVAGL